MKERQHLKFILSVALVALSCLCVAIINDFRRPFSDPYFSKPSHINLRWMLWMKEKDVQDQETVQKRAIRSRTNYPIVVSEPYKINNKDICRGVEKVSCIVIVHTAADHFLRRLRMRTTWLNSTHYSPENVRVVFLVGLVSDPILQLRIEQESNQYKDIVQGNFIDSYRNLTNKGVMGYKWISEHCMNAQFVAKVDDDAFINFFKFFEEMDHLKQKTKYILCNKIEKGTMKIIREHNSKWYVQEDEYKNMTRYPHTYCSGFTVFMSTDLVPMLYRAAIGSPFFWVDDFYLFGLLPSRVHGVVHENIRPNLTFFDKEAYQCYLRNGKKCQYLVFPAKDKDIAKMWLAVTQDRTQSVYGNYYMDLPSIQQISLMQPT